MQIGCHGLVWSGSFDAAGMRRCAAAARAAGYDFVEIPLLEPDAFDVAAAKAALDEHGLGATASLGLPEGADISIGDPDQAAAGERLLNEVLEILAALGSSYLCGVIYSRLHKYAGPATPAQREGAQAVLRRVAQRADDLGITLALEVVNRYETNQFNTARQALAFIDEVGHPNVGLHLDTYHMNIEEPDMWQPVLDGADRLRYVHIGESHRGYLGTGTIDFDAFFSALGRVGFDGPIAFESFSTAVVSEALSNDLAIWRNLWDDGDDLAVHANRYIRGALRAVETVALH